MGMDGKDNDDRKKKEKQQKQLEDEILLEAQKALERENKARQELEEQYLVDNKNSRK